MHLKILRILRQYIFKHASRSLTDPHQTSTMFSPTAIRELVATLNPMDNPVVPHFIFPLNNKSSSPHPRKEAFKFRDGIVIVSTPILSESNAYECLQKACLAFGIDPPVRWDMLPITRGITTTQSMQYVKNFAEVIKRRKADSESARLAEFRSHNLDYFNFPEQFTSNAPNVPNPSGPMWPATPLPPTKPNVGSSEHIEEKAVIDDRDWQDRLVPSVKMEAARRKYVIRMMEAGMFFSRDSTGEDDVELAPAPAPAPASGFLLTRDGQRRAITMAELNDSWPETNEIRRDWCRIEVWRHDVAVQWGRVPISNIIWKREADKRQTRENQDWRRSSTEDTRKEIRDARNRIEDIRTKKGKGNGKEAGAVEATSQFRPTKILSRNDQMSKVGESTASKGDEAVLGGLKNFSEMRKLAIRERRTLPKEKPATFEELKKFSEEMKLSTAPPKDNLQILGKGKRKDHEAQEAANNNIGGWETHSKILEDSGIVLANEYEAGGRLS